MITGGKTPKYIIAGGGFVIPIFRRSQFFDMCVRTISSGQDEIKTKTLVPVVVQWTAQVRPSKELEKLERAIRSFSERLSEGRGRGDDAVIRDLRLTLDGAVREVVAKMTPEEVSNDKEKFTKEVLTSVAPELENFGMELVSLNIQDVIDNHEYYNRLAAKDSEIVRQTAEQVKASADQAIRERKAEAGRIATEAELNSNMAVAEREAETARISQEAKLASEMAVAAKTRDTEVAKSKYLAEQETAAANAEIARQLQAAQRQKELATNEGQITIERQVQANLAEQKRQEVEATKAETDKRVRIITAEADVEKAKREKDRLTTEAETKAVQQTISAEAQAKVKSTEAEGEAEALRREADGKATATKREAEGNAQAIKLEAEAEAERIEKTGAAEATATEAKGLAEAAAIKARGLAEAESERALAEARAGNDKVNFEIAKLEIERDTRIQIATSVATVVANIGEKATFVDFGSGDHDDGSNVLTRVLSDIPKLMKKLDVENMALNGVPVTDTINQLVSSVVSPLGVLAEKQTIVGENALLGDNTLTTDTASFGPMNIEEK